MDQDSLTTNPQVEKRRLRRSMVQTILALEPRVRAEQEAKLASAFPSLPGYADARTVLLYVTAFPEEIATRSMLKHALAQGKTLVCPRVDRREQRLRLYRVEDLDRDFKPGMLKIPEPQPHCQELDAGAIDWVLVPGLAFNPQHYRVGRGAGHYDRLLPTLREGTPRWALALDCQLVPSFPVETHDVPLDGVVTPAQLS